ncbi:uncharacterized protein TNIN_139631 [Trichonephila inaurata madagascariensis]|uniref:Uncharacterized protein n=1 Tax=Trichonephila inaurata madagascariensis TaxID=2747483 RepID=A0A8X7CPH5_9ARAC|nr:uncharacterized protein TNIN_139631 [Trichonephila inaurata madagascariensis]
MFKSSASFYRHLGRWSSTLVCCPECREPMTVRHFYSTHAPQKYNLDCRKQCLFCFGRKQWSHGQKNRPENVNHVMACLQRFVEDAKEESEIEEEETVEEEVCGCRDIQPVPRDMQGRSKDRLSEYVGFYDSLKKPEIREEGIEFQGGLGKDVWGIVQRYLREDLMWFHIMVKHDMFDTFRKEMEKIRDQCVLLPFWCLCDGLVNEKGKTQHRHMILACEQESSFKDVWKGKIRYEFPNSGRAKKCVKIKSAFHLVRTILYVSQPKSSCDKGEIPYNLMDPVDWSHFHMNRPLHPHSIAFLCTLFPGGIEKLLWEQVGNKNVAKWEKTTRRRADAWGHFKWSVPIHVTGWKFVHCMIPLHPRYEETEEWTPLCLNLYGNKKITFKRGKQWERVCVSTD